MRVSSRGMGIGVLCLIVVGAGIGLRLPELVAVAGGLLFLLLVSVLSVAFRTRVEVTPPEALRVPRGLPATLDVALLDHGARPLSGMLLRRRGGVGPEVVGLPRLRPGLPAVAAIAIPTGSRGPLLMGPWAVERVDAWLFARRVVTRVPPVEVIVIPRVYAVSVTSLLGSEGEQRASVMSGNTDVSTLRDYVVGDEPRHIHWRSSAKAGNLMVKQHVESRRPGVHVALDVSAASYASAIDFEEAVDVAASVAISAALTGIAVDLTTTAGESARAGGGRHAGVLDLLSRVDVVSEVGSTRRFDEGSVVLVTGSRGPSGSAWGARTTVRVGGSPDVARPTGGVIAVANARALVELAAP